jgi:hypothetical protein
MSHLPAQIAFLIQISFVLSVTETSIIFMIQIHQTNKEIAAIQDKNNIKVQIILVIVSNISA